MSSASLEPAETELVDFPTVAGARAGFWFAGLLAAAVWFGAAMVIGGLPDIDDFERTGLLARSAAGLAGVLLVLTVGERVLRFAIPGKLRGAGPWLVFLAVALMAWELATAKYAVLPRPFFASPQALLEVFTDDYVR